MSKPKIKSKPTNKITSYLEQNRYFFWLLEASIIIGFAYSFSILYFLNITIITSHVSNLIGSIILCLLLIRPKAFRTPKSMMVVWSAISIILLNIILELFHHNAEIFNVKFNTPDPWDGLFGLLGVVVVVIVHNKTTQKS